MTRPLIVDILIAAWAVIDCWLVYGVAQHLLWRL